MKENKRRNSYDTYRRYIPAIIIVAMIALVISVVMKDMGKGEGKQKPISANTTTPGLVQTNDVTYDRQFIGVVTAIDVEKKGVTFYNIDGNQEIMLYYSGATKVTDKFDQDITMLQLSIGEIVNAYYCLDNDLVAVAVSKDAWEYKKVNNLVISNEKKMMTISSRNYQFTDKLIIASGDKLINMIDLSDKDELTLKGIGSKVYSIMVTKGHGYVRFSNYRDFYGGNLEIGTDNMLEITEDMLVVVREGDYTLTMENQGLKGSKLIHVYRDQELLVDMGEFRKETPKKGKVEFTVLPDGADFSINGKAVDYSEPIELEYGEYTVTVSLSGYETYTGKIMVNESSMQFYIALAKEVVTEDNTDSDNSTKDNNSSTNSNSNTNSSSSSDSSLEDEVKNSDKSNNSVDSEHKIYIQTPVGATVYWDGKQMGIAPINFTKQVGSYTITLSADGYQTISYPVVVADDKQDVYLNFPNLTAK